MRDALVGADRLRPDNPLARVLGSSLESQPGYPVAHCGTHDALRVETVEGSLQPDRLRLADQSLGRPLDVVEEELPLLLGRAQRGRDVLALQPWRVGVDE